MSRATTCTDCPALPFAAQLAPSQNDLTNFLRSYARPDEVLYGWTELETQYNTKELVLRVSLRNANTDEDVHSWLAHLDIGVTFIWLSCLT